MIRLRWCSVAQADGTIRVVLEYSAVGQDEDGYPTKPEWEPVLYESGDMVWYRPPRVLEPHR